MKLTSKEICPITVRDRLVKNLAGQDVAVCDIVKALEWAEAKCLELNEKKELANRQLLKRFEYELHNNFGIYASMVDRALFIDKFIEKLTNEQS